VTLLLRSRKAALWEPTEVVRSKMVEADRRRIGLHGVDSLRGHALAGQAITFVHRPEHIASRNHRSTNPDIDFGPARHRHHRTRAPLPIRSTMTFAALAVAMRRLRRRWSGVIREAYRNLLLLVYSLKHMRAILSLDNISHM
jgi:hypothetical protein